MSNLRFCFEIINYKQSQTLGIIYNETDSWDVFYYKDI